MSLSPLEKAASGALASAIANTLVYPLDLSKTLIQTQVKKPTKSSPSATSLADSSSSSSELEDSVYAPKKQPPSGELKYKSTLDVLQKIYAKKGVLGWYHGLLSSIFGTAAQNFSYFYWYTIVKRVYANLNKHIPNHKPTTATELFLGALAAAISQLFTMPIGVITTQQQTDRTHKSLLQLTKDILNQDGITGLWRGLRVSLVLCVNPSITYGSYERLKQIFYGGKEFLGPLESFSIGVLAKSLATVATQPLIVSKAMLQKKQPDRKTTTDLEKQGVKKTSEAEEDEEEEEEEDDVKFQYFTDALHHLWETENIKGLYKGIAPQLLKGVFVQGLLFMFKDQIDMVFLLLLASIKKKGVVKR